MKREEVDFLKLKKIKEGKTYKEIKEEITELLKFQNGIKLNVKILAQKQKKIYDLEEKIKRLQERLQTSILRKEVDLEDGDNITLMKIKRTLNLIKSGEITKIELRRLVNISERKMKIILSFLKKNKLIEKIPQ